jgi:hypothetical protein
MSRSPRLSAKVKQISAIAHRVARELLYAIE